MALFIQLALVVVVAAPAVWAQDLWRSALERRSIHRFSTLFTAQNVRDYLSTDKGIADAIAWCKQTGVTKVYLETYRSQYTADQKALERARDRFSSAGFAVAGCVTTTRIGKISTGWNVISCYTNQKTQADLRSIFRYTALMFNEIMIDDFWFTDCTCDECDRARQDRMVRIRTDTYPVGSDSWEDYRSELMLQLSRSHVIGAAREVNSKVRLIVKYPQWYDRFHERGYDVVRQTEEFDRIWVGTETRDRDKRNGRQQYEGYFIMRWLGGIGGSKTGGGWFDSLDTTEKTYIEQARQTILGGARESMLFSYGTLHQNFGPEDIAALRPQIPQLLDVAAEVRKRRAIGVAAYKPPGSPHEGEINVFDYVGMLGIPLAPTHEFPAQAPAIFLSNHAGADTDIVERLDKYIASGRPVLLTDGIARWLTGKIKIAAENVHVLRVGGRPEGLLETPRRELDELRKALLEPFGVTFEAPADVALYLFDDKSWVVENFGDREVNVTVNGAPTMVGAREWVQHWE